MARLALLALTAVDRTRPDKMMIKSVIIVQTLNTWQHGVVHDHLIIEWPEKRDLWLPCNLGLCWSEMLLTKMVMVN